MDKNLKIFGFDRYFNHLISLYKKKRFPNKIILSGKTGIGKTTFSHHIINSIFSENEKFNYDNETKTINELNKSYQLVKKNVHPNFFKISSNNDKNNIEIDQIRRMINFINKSSFDSNYKIVLIENIEYLNKFSSNALLKSIEEPNKDVIFILLLNSEYNVLDTVKSRCIEYKLNLNNKYIEEIVNFYFKENIFNNISDSFKNYYISPSMLINFILFCNEEELDYKNISIDDFLKYYFNYKIYKNKNNINNDIKFYLELFFYNKIIKLKNSEIINLYNYFNKRFNLVNTFNLDKESFFIEFKSKVFNEQ
tara:strand:- start:995 stop:1921 length:927 start_codon:yes stop_codon:yes gene_type:complete